MENERNDIYARINAGIDEFFSSNNFKDYLKVMSRFHRYSMRNIILIKQQLPEATRVAGYQTWKELGRQVKHGESGIRIIRPDIRIIEEKTDQVDENGNQIIEKISVPRFTTCSVFDISQTEGKELPSPVHELTGDVKQYEQLMDAVRRVSAYSFVIDDIGLGDAYGLCDHAIRTIFVRPDLTPAQTLKTSVHELFHSRCHGGDTILERNQKEIEAEAAAYVVCDHFGLDTSDYSFGYISAWAAEMDHAARKSCIRNIHKEASLIINEMENALMAERTIGNENLSSSATEKIVMSEAVERLQQAGIEHDSLTVSVYDTKPAETEEIMMYLANEYYNYRGAARIRGLTKHEIITVLETGRGKFSDFVAYMESQGCELEILEPDDSFNYVLSYNMNEQVVYDLKPESAASVSVMVGYGGPKSDNEVFSALNESETKLSGAKVHMNPVKLEPPAEPYTERLENYENAGYSSAWPMVSVTYSNVDNTPAYNMNIHDAVQYIDHLSDDVVNDPQKYMIIRISYTYNDWNYEHVQNLDFGKGRMNFIDYLQLAPNLIRHLKSHSSLIGITNKAGKFAPDTTYGREYEDRVLAWAEYCRMELNHNSDAPVIPKPPLLDELYNTSGKEQDFWLDR